MELWEAAQRFGLQLGFFFDSFDDLIELSRVDADAFRSLLANLESQFKTRSDYISDKRVIYAIAISLYNTHPDSMRKKIEDSYVSRIYINQDSARDILSIYGTSMSNPVAFMVNPERMYHSILQGKRLEQPLIYAANGKRNKPRAVGAYAFLSQYNLLDIESIDIDSYHPTVWHLLKENKLIEYQHIFSNAIHLCETWIQSSIRKRQRTMEE